MSVYSPAYVGLAIDSILAQSYPDFEFVIVDDSANAGTAALLDGYAAREARIVLHHNAVNLGQTRSLNLGLRLARGSFIARQDDDDISLPDRLAREMALLEAQPQVGLVGTQMQLIDAQGAALAGPRHFPLDDAALQAELWRSCCFCHGSVVVRRACLPASAPYDESLKPAEDYDLWLRLAEATQLANVDAPLYQFRIHASSQSSRKRPVQLYHSGMALENALRRRWPAEPPALAARQTARYYLEAAVLAWGVGDQALAGDSLARGLAVAPNLLATDEPLLGILSDAAFGQPAAEAAAGCQALFGNLLPATRQLAHLKSRFISRLHMQAVYRQMRAGRVARPSEHLLPSIRHDPSWLLNRGVLAILIRSSLPRDGR
jgi:hypothetical protein